RLNAKPVGKFTVEAVFLTREIPTGRRLQLVEQRKERGFLYFPGGQGQSVVIRKAQLAGALVAQSDELFQQRRYLAPHCFAGRPSLFTQPLVALLPQDLVQVVSRQTPSVELDPKGGVDRLDFRFELHLAYDEFLIDLVGQK